MKRKLPSRPIAPRLPGASAQTPAARDIGAYLRIAFADVLVDELPPAFADLLARLGIDEPPEQRDHAGLPDNEFKTQLAAAIPRLRLYARSISGNMDVADDLVQETLLKAWAARSRFQAGTNMRAWTCVILRNHHFSEVRRARFKGEWDDFAADLILAEPPSQEGHIILDDVQRALLQLPATMREALMLVGAGGMAYDDVAKLCGCAVGTIKSRVARGRVALAALLEGDAMLPRSAASHAASDASIELARPAEQAGSKSA